MKALMKFFMAIYVALYRRTSGKIGGTLSGSKVLLLNTTGRKSGRAITVPLGAFDHQDGWVIVASNGGKRTNPAWYHNLKSKPQTSVQLFDKVIPVAAEMLTGEARAKAWQQVIAASPNYAAYEKRTTREIPLMLLRPAK